MAIEFCETRPAEKLQRYPDFAAGNRSAMADAVQAVHAVIIAAPAVNNSLTTKQYNRMIAPSPFASPGD